MTKLKFEFSTLHMRLLKTILELAPGATELTITQTASGIFHVQEYMPVVLIEGEHIVYTGTAAGALKAL